MRYVVINNERISTLLEQSWHLIDLDDIDEFSAFQVHQVHFKTEFDNSLKTPFMIYEHVGAISYMSSSMSDRIKSKFQAKTLKLQEFRV